MRCRERGRPGEEVGEDRRRVMMLEWSKEVLLCKVWRRGLAGCAESRHGIVLALGSSCVHGLKLRSSKRVSRGRRAT